MITATKDIGAAMIVRAEDINDILNEIDNGLYVEYQIVHKNGSVRNAYIARKSDCMASPILYYDRGWWTKSNYELAEYIRDVFENNHLQIQDIASCMMNKSYILSHVLPRVISAERIDNLKLEGRYYNHILDIAVIYYVPINKEDDLMSSACLTETMVSDLGIEDEIQDAAIFNLEQQSKTMYMSEFLHLYESDQNEGIPIVIGTNKSQINGAAVILSPSILEEMRRKLAASEILILPSSIHEVLALGSQLDRPVEELRQMVVEINQAIVSEDDRLTNSVYLWDGVTLTQAEYN